LQITNKAYVHEEIELVGHFSKIHWDNFISEILKIDFGNNIRAATFINLMVQSETNDKIFDVILPGILFQIYVTNN